MSPRLLPWIALGVFLAPSTPVPASSPTDYETKAGYLLNLVEFVEWPAGAFADAQSPVILGVIGKDPFGAELERMQGKIVNGRKVQIKRFKGALEFRGEETPGRRQEGLMVKHERKFSELRSCHILFISSSERSHVPFILKPLKDAGVLTVSETATFAREGGMVNFLDDGNRVQLEINLEAAEQARLKISSKLLSLARIVRNEKPAGKK